MIYLNIFLMLLCQVGFGLLCYLIGWEHGRRSVCRRIDELNRKMLAAIQVVRVMPVETDLDREVIQ